MSNDQWSDPKVSSQGEVSADSIYLEVGRAISAWERVEESLAGLFKELCAGEHSESLKFASERIYGHLTVGSQRVKLLTEVAQLYAVFVDSSFDVAALKSLTNQYLAASHSRSKIAHGVARSIKRDDETIGFFLAPSAYISKSNVRLDQVGSVALSGKSNSVWTGWMYSYTASDINYFAQKYDELRVEVDKLVGTILARKFAGFHFQVPPPLPAHSAQT